MVREFPRKPDSDIFIGVFMMKTAIAALFSLIFMIFHADLITKGAAAGLLLWYSSVVPALFPFMVLSSMLSASQGIFRLVQPLALIFRFSRLSPEGIYVLLTGLFCGCPMGAKTCADFLAEKRISSGEAKFLFALCNHPSPMFLTGFVYPMFASQIPLSSFVFAIYMPLLLLAIPAYWIYQNASPCHSGIPFSSRNPGSGDTSGSAFSPDTAILDSAEILVKIGGYLIFYSILILVIQNIPGIPDPVRLFFSGVLEITTGIRSVSASLPYPYSAIAAASIFSFGGFSAMSQTNAVIRLRRSSAEIAAPAAPNGFLQNSLCRTEKTAGLSIRQYLLWKIAHAALTAAIMAVLTGALRFHIF